MENLRGTQTLLSFLIFVDAFLLCDAQIRRPTKCELEPSINEGPNYFRRLTPWGKWLDMPCAPGTHFIQSKCGCDFIPADKLPQTTTKRKSTTTPSTSTSKKVKVTSPIRTTSKSTENTTKKTRLTTTKTPPPPTTISTKITTPPTTTTSTKQTTPLPTTTTAKETTPLTTTTTTKQTTPLTTTTTSKQTTPLTTATTSKQSTPPRTTTIAKLLTTPVSTPKTTQSRPSPSLATKTTTTTTTIPTSSTTTPPRTITTVKTEITKKPSSTASSQTSTYTISTSKKLLTTTTPTSTKQITKLPSAITTTEKLKTLHTQLFTKSVNRTTIIPPASSASTGKQDTSAGVGTQYRTEATSKVTTRKSPPKTTTKGTPLSVTTSTGSPKSVTSAIKTSPNVLSNTSTISSITTGANTLSPKGRVFTTSAVQNLTIGDKVTTNINSTGQTLKPITSTTSASGTPSMHNSSVDITTKTQPAEPSKSPTTPTVVIQTKSMTELPTSTTTDTTTTTATKTTTTTEIPVSITTTRVTTGSPTSTTRATFTTTTSTPCKFKKVVDDKYSYLEFINDEIGWIQFQCQHGKEFNLTYCGCFYPGEKPQTTTLETTSAASTTAAGSQSDCPYKKEGRVSFKEYIEQLQSWVYSECADGYVFSQIKCGCVLEGTAPKDEIDNVAVTKLPITKVTIETTGSTILTTIKVPDDCPYVAVGDASFREYVDAVQSWVYSDCPDGQIFSQRQCICISKDCPYKADGGTSFRKYIEDIGEWVHAECTDGHVFSHRVCNCVPGGDNTDETNTGRETTLGPSGTTLPPVTNPNCPFVPVELGYREYIAEIDHWVTYMCPIDKIFDVLRCACVNQPIIKTTIVSEIITMTTPEQNDCPYEGAGFALYREYVKKIDQWVYYECPYGQIFNNDKCMCVKDDTGDDKDGDSKSITPAPTQQPTVLVTSPDCPFAPDNDGYREFIPDIQQWVTYECPSNHEFSVARCMCVDKYRNQSMTTTASTTKDCKYEKADDNLYREYLDQLKDWVYYECPRDQMFSIDKCLCLEKPDHATDNKKTDVAQTTVLTSPASFIRNPDCAFEAKGDGYREFVVEVGQWVTYECPQGQTFDVMVCSCADKDSTKPASVTEPTTEKNVCNSRPSDMGKDHYFMNVTGWGEVLYNCDSGQFYSQKACGCVKNEIILTTPLITASVRTTKKITFINPGCALMPSSLGPEHFKMDIGGFGWVEFSCPAGDLFDYAKCSCEPA